MLVSHPIYKGCMRPAMLWGVPMVPSMVVVGTLCVLCSAFTMWISLLIPLSLFVMRLMVAKDQFIFDIMVLNFRTKIKVFKSRFTTYRDTSLIVVSV